VPSTPLETADETIEFWSAVMNPRQSRFGPLSIVATLMALSIATAVPVAADDAETCIDQLDSRDANCSRAITSGKFKGHDLAMLYLRRAAYYYRQGNHDRAVADLTEAIQADTTFAVLYFDRGTVWQAKNDYDLAIADLTEAIRLQPRFTLAYIARGSMWQATGHYDDAVADPTVAVEIAPRIVNAYTNLGDAYRARGNIDRAVAAYNEAIRLDPKFGRASIIIGGPLARVVNGADPVAYAYYNRGRFFLYSGSPSRAQADLKRANELDPKYAYTALWLDIAERRGNISRDLADRSKQLDMESWPAAVVRLFLGELSPAETLAAADDDNPDRKQAQVCQANFYTGELALIGGERREAIRLFQLAATECPHRFIEWKS
jgi:lipoprotein NlpI